ncbi:MAG: DNA repair protein RecO [Elusimicrobiota bacterium]
MYTIKTEGIVIRSYDYGEGHRIVVIFSEDKGKLRAVARGSRKTKSKFGASLEPLSENQFMLHRKPNAELYTVTGCNVLNPHARIRGNMSSFAYASLVSEGVDLLCVDEDPDQVIYRFFSEVLDDIESCEPASSAWLFFFRLLKCAGYRLDLFKCCQCGNKELDEMVFSSPSGGILCADCRSDAKDRISVSEETLKSVRMLSPHYPLAAAAEKQISLIVEKFIKYQFEKELRSLGFLELFRTTGIARKVKERGNTPPELIALGQE